MQNKYGFKKNSSTYIMPDVTVPEVDNKIYFIDILHLTQISDE